MKTATFMAAMWTKRDMLEAKEFRSTAPIIAVNGGTAYSCLNKKVTELDLPYFIVINTPEGEKEMGFAKTRKFYDGCTETPTLAKAKAKGEKVEMLPAEAQIILGAPQPGYTLSEMPSVGLNVGGGGGITGSFDFAHAPVVSILGEFNLAKYTGVSELHAFGRLNIGFGLKDGFFGVTDKINTIIANNSTGLSGILSNDADFNLLAGLDLGILKRFYAHAFFFEAGAAISTTAYLLQTAPGFEDWTAMIIGIAGLPHVGVGFQLSPRLMMRFMVGFKAGVSYLLLQNSLFDYSAFLTDTAAMELGVVGGFHILYNI